MPLTACATSTVTLPVTAVSKCTVTVRPLFSAVCATNLEAAAPPAVYEGYAPKKEEKGASKRPGGLPGVKTPAPR